MERQYIGARYVPKFFENPSTGDSAWLAGVAYEPLTIVTYAGNSYTSKKSVPAGIGSPNTASEYWVSTGIYNAQVEQLRTEVQECQNDIEEVNTKVDRLANRKYIFVADSYGSYYDGNGKDFMTLACEYLGITENSYIVSRGTAGFFREGEMNFLAVLHYLDNTITDRESITDIFVFGGANDQVSPDAATIKTGIRTFCSYAKATYPNAAIHIGFVSKTWAPAYYPNYPRTLKVYTECGEYGASYLKGSEYIMNLSTLFRNDFVHPTEAAVPHIAHYVADLILCGECDVVYEPLRENNFTIVNEDYSASILSDSTVQTFRNGITVLGCGAGGAGLNINCNIPSLIADANTIRGFKLLRTFAPPLVNYTNASPCFVRLVTSTAEVYSMQGLMSFESTPNSDGSYNMLLVIYLTTAIQNVTRITLGFNNVINV